MQIIDIFTVAESRRIAAELLDEADFDIPKVGRGKLIAAISDRLHQAWRRGNDAGFAAGANDQAAKWTDAISKRS